jgi:hypothetical protein
MIHAVTTPIGQMRGENSRIHQPGLPRSAVGRRAARDRARSVSDGRELPSTESATSMCQHGLASGIAGLGASTAAQHAGANRGYTPTLNAVVQPFRCVLVRPTLWPSNRHCWHRACRLDVNAVPHSSRHPVVAPAVAMSLAIICLSDDDGSSKIGPIASMAADDVQRVKPLATVDRLQDMSSICRRCCTTLSNVVDGM